MPGIVDAGKMVIRVYADVKNLRSIYNGTNDIPQINDLEEFLRGFNMADPLCDFVDAGCGKECSRAKLHGT